MTPKKAAPATSEPKAVLSAGQVSDIRVYGVAHDYTTGQTLTRDDLPT